MIEVVGMSKRFGPLTALDDVHLAAPAGAILGLLGHNGAGKSTLVNILATLSPPSGGTATVAGYDIVRQARQVRRRIGLTGQFATVDQEISGRDNLVLIARLLGAGAHAARARARELLTLFGLTDAANRRVRTYSGGMRRRLDLAASLVGRPPVLFLDEPTTGLDPVSRLNMWQILRRLVEDGTTVLLTTQHLEEADRLADSIAVLSEGRVIASGTPAELKARVGERTVTARLSDPADLARAVMALDREGLRPVHDEKERSVTVPVAGSRDVAVIVRLLDAVGVEARELTFAEPGIDEVYLTLVRHSATPGLVGSRDT
ncbi:ATP-binding cassette domain-containing protein [Actinoallomurus vinaceus]